MCLCVCPSYHLQAVELLTLAAEKGDANAQLNLGIMYAKGRGVDKDEGKAFHLLAMAAEQVRVGKNE